MTTTHKRRALSRALSIATVALGGVMMSACGTLSTQSAATGGPIGEASFGSPVKLQAAGADVKTELPGYAAPAWYDVTGDGRADLVVGQFKGGLINVYAQNSDGSLAERQLLQADGKDASVPGIW